MKARFPLLCIVLMVAVQATALAQPATTNEREIEERQRGLISISENEDGESLAMEEKHRQSVWYKAMQKKRPNYFEVKKLYETYFAQHTDEKSKSKEVCASWLKTQLFYLDRKNRVVPPPTVNYNEIRSTKPGVWATVTDTVAGDWRMLGPRNMFQTNYSGVGNKGGYVSCARIDPVNPNKLFIGFTTGGLWVSSDGGAIWQLTDKNLPDREYIDLDVCEANNSYVYAISRGNAAAVIRSTDGGLTWSSTALNSTNYSGVNAYDLAVSPSDPNIVVARWGTTLYRTTDGGTTWTSVLTGLKNYSVWGGTNINAEVLDFHASGSSVVYHLDRNDNQNYVTLYRSADAGLTFSNLGNIIIPAGATGHIVGWAKLLSATNNPAAVYVALGTGSSAYGHHSVQLLKLDATTGAILQAKVEMVTGDPGVHHGDIAMDINNDNNIIYGSYAEGKAHYSTNNGTSFILSSTTVHSDLRALSMVNGKVLLGTDGEALYSADNGATFTNLSASISNHELWGFGAAHKSDILGAGTNHGPLIIREHEGPQGWYNAMGADQGNSDVNPIDDRYLYSQGYNTYHVKRTGPRSMTSGAGGQEIDPGGIYAYFNTMHFHPNLYYTLITHHAGQYPTGHPNLATWKNSLIRSDNNGVTINKVIKTFAAQVFREDICMTDTNRIYVVEGLSSNKLWKTSDGGATWTEITPSSLITGTSIRNISDIAVSDVNPDEIWVAYSGVQNTCQILHSTNGGATYTNLTTATLTSFPITKIIFQRGTNGGVYVGNKSGIFYRNNSMSDWQKLGNGLPMVDVRFMFINYWKGKLMIGTSRGAWDHSLYENTAPRAQISADRNCLVPGGSVQFADYSALHGDTQTTYLWSFSGGVPSSSTAEKPVVSYPAPGKYSVTLTVTDQYGSNTQTLTNFITVDGSAFSNCTSPSDIPSGDMSLIYFDSQETAGEDGAAINAVDGNPGTIWHTKWSGGSDPYPHELQIALGATYSISKFKYLPRQNGTNGRVASYEIYVSDNSSSWGTAVATGSFANDATEKIVTFTAKSGRYIRFRALSEVNGNPWASAAEIKVAGCLPQACSLAQDLSQTAWRLVSVSSQETTGENGAAANAFDGNTSTQWHTQYTPTTVPYPHEVQIDMNATYALSQFKYLPRQDGGTNGRVKDYEVYVSASTADWGIPVAAGSFASDASEKLVVFTEKNGRYIRFRALSEVNGNPWASAAEIKVSGCAITACPSANDNLVNDDFSSAVQIPVNKDMYGKITPAGDNDYYKFTIVTGGTITVTLSNLPVNYDLRLYNSAQVQIAVAQNNGTSSETINYTAAAGTYYLRVHSRNSVHDALKCYVLQVATGTATGAQYGVTPVTQSPADLNGKEIMEVFPNPITNVLNIRLSGYQGNTEVQVFDIQGQQVLQRELSNGTTALDVKTLAAGVYLVQLKNKQEKRKIKVVKK